MPIGIGIGISPVLLGGDALGSVSAPTNLVAVQNGNDVDLAWTDNATNETEYRIYRSSDGSSYSLIDTIAADSTSYTDTAPGSGIWYYKVAAANASGETLSDAATVIVYLLRDEFTTARAVGAVAGTAAEPGPGTRIVPADVGGNISITGGDLSIVGGTSNWDQTSFGYSDAITRNPGVALFMRHNQALNAALNIGFWATNIIGGVTNSLYFRNIVGQIDFSEGIRGQVGTAVGTYTGGTDYDIVIIMKSTGFMVVIRGGAYTDWTVLHQGGTLTTTPMYAGTNVFSVGSNVLQDFYRITQLPAPFHTDASMATLSGVLTGTAKAALDAVVPS